LFFLQNDDKLFLKATSAEYMQGDAVANKPQRNRNEVSGGCLEYISKAEELPDVDG
jgi:hypothetical protein